MGDVTSSAGLEAQKVKPDAALMNVYRGNSESSERCSFKNV